MYTESSYTDLGIFASRFKEERSIVGTRLSAELVEGTDMTDSVAGGKTTAIGMSLQISQSERLPESHGCEVLPSDQRQSPQGGMPPPRPHFEQRENVGATGR